MTNNHFNWFEYFRFQIAKTKHPIIFVSDCDGVLTDDRSYFTHDQKVLKAYCSQDKEAVKYICDYAKDQIYFVTGDKAGYDITKYRIGNFFSSCEHKTVWCEQYDSDERITFIEELKRDNPHHEIVFIGNALSDIGAMCAADWALTVNNANDYVKRYANIISKKDGGNGGFAELIFTFYEHYHSLDKKKQFNKNRDIDFMGGWD